MEDWKNKVQSVLLIVAAWLLAIGLLYIVIIKIKLFSKWK